MKPRSFLYALYALGVPALLSVYVGCGGAEPAEAEEGSTRKGSSSKAGKGGTGGKGGGGGAVSSSKGGAGGGELVIDDQEPDTCSHDACDPGLPLPEQCSPCVGTVCGTRPACCNDHWDDECTHLARGVATCACDDGGIGTGVAGSTGTGTGGAQSSGKGGTTGTGGAQTSGKGGSAGASTGTGGATSTPVPSCSHTPCEEGGPLKTKCSLCAAQVCAQKASCCLDGWTAECLQVAATVQGCSCSPGNGGGGTSTGTAGSSTGKGGSAGAGSSTGGSSSGKGGSASSGGNGSGSTGSGSTGSGSTGSGSTGSGSNGSGSGGNGSGGTNGSGSTGSGSTGSGSTGSGSTGSGSTGSGSSSASGGNGSSSSGGGNGGQAGFLVGGAGGESGGCHSPCEEGDALSQFCGVVPFGICLYDPFCCDRDNGSWNAACVGYATKLFLCPKKDDEHGAEPSCDHDVCAVGTPLKTDCDDCTAKVCAKDAYCCESNWDGLCIAKASELCEKCNEDAGKCDHAVCAVGGPLKTDCEPCVAEVCKADDYCCKTNWDSFCVNSAADLCECGKTCDHEPCTRGGPLKKSCSETTKAVCAEDAYCCSSDWDNLCVDLAAEKGACGDKCSHDPCETGTALQPDCGDCEKKICDKDPTCCDFSHGWDIVCQYEVGELCGKTCD